MKKLLSFLLVLLPGFLLAQNVAINNDGSLPDNSALLDIKSNSKGLLIPRMTTTERTGILSPAVGLTVFDMETVSYWMYRGDLNGGWAELQHMYQKQWNTIGPDMYNTNNGNVGIGTNTPASKLTINGTDPVIGIMNNGLATGYVQASGFDLKMNTAPDNPLGKLVLGTKGNDYLNIDHLGRVSIGTNSTFDAEFKFNATGSSPRFAFMQNDIPTGLIRVVGSDFKIGTYSIDNSRIVFSPKGVDKIWIDENGQMGIGTASPSSLLTINGSNPLLQIRHNNADKGFLQALGNDIKLGTNAVNTSGNLYFQTEGLDRMVIDDNGLVGIGTTTPSAALTVNGNNPILQMRHNNADKGFLQLVGDDVKIGTNISNVDGSFIIRTGGADRITVDEFGRVSFTDNPSNYEVRISTAAPLINFYGSNGGSSMLSYSNTTQDLLLQKTNLGGGNIVFNATGGFSATALRLSTNGLMSFGTGLFPATYKFSVEGRVIATDFVAQSVGSWPDYVFANDYKLKPLAEVKQFIEENKHLPNIPSAAAIEKEGIQLGDMSKRLMEKVEELTLYILQLQEQIDELKKELPAKTGK